MADYAATCSAGEPQYASEGAVIYADCASKPDEWVMSDGARITGVYTTPEFISHVQELRCGDDPDCRGKVAAFALEWASAKRQAVRDADERRRQAIMMALVGPSSDDGGETNPVVLYPPLPPAPLKRPETTNCRTYQAGNEVLTDCTSR